MPQQAQFWDRLAERYAQKPIDDIDAYQQTLDRTRSYLSRDDDVLEIGCGTGSTALLLADAVHRMTASDISSGMIDIARAKDQPAGPVDFMHATVFDDRLEPESFDVVLAFNLLHLIDDTAGAVRQVHRLLKPGGLFISKTPCLAGRNPLLRIMVPAMRLIGRAPYVRFLGVEELDRLIAAQGFKIVETGCYPAKPANRFVVARKA